VKYMCILSYILSILLVAIFSLKIVNIRSKCTFERAKITKVLKGIEELKEENNRLTNEFFRKLNPKTIDSETQHMKLLHENEVKYLR
jgi:FtsZ-binding cell division protein ZapB